MYGFSYWELFHSLYISSIQECERCESSECDRERDRPDTTSQVDIQGTVHIHELKFIQVDLPLWKLPHILKSRKT